MKLDNNQQAFFALVRAGLWEQEARLLSFGEINFSQVLALAEEQSVVGLVAAGLEHVTDYIVPKEDVFQFVGQTLQLEKRNRAMNDFIRGVVDKMSKVGIYTLLVKGQGIAQCYERPLWRTCGDVDFFLSNDNYIKAVDYLSPMATNVDEEVCYYKHIAMNITPWTVELHGSLRSGLWKGIDQELDEIKNVILQGGNVRSWLNGNTQVFLPRGDEDVVYVFTHILQHFYKEGIGLRQICDWCRLLWKYKDTIDKSLLESRLKKMKVMTEWRTFGAFAVEYLGMPKESMLFYSEKERWRCKSKRIMKFILMTGNFGHNRDYSFYQKYPFLVFKIISLWRHLKDAFIYLLIFPLDSIKVTERRMRVGLFAAIKGEMHE